MTNATSIGGSSPASVSTLRGIAWLALTGLILVGVTGVVRHLGFARH